MKKQEIFKNEKKHELNYNLLEQVFDGTDVAEENEDVYAFEDTFFEKV